MLHEGLGPQTKEELVVSDSRQAVIARIMHGRIWVLHAHSADRSPPLLDPGLSVSICLAIWNPLLGHLPLSISTSFRFASLDPWSSFLPFRLCGFARAIRIFSRKGAKTQSFSGSIDSVLNQTQSVHSVVQCSGNANIEHRTSNIEHRTSIIEHRTLNIQLRTEEEPVSAHHSHRHS